MNIGYCRVSKKELASGGVSLDVQEQRIRAYAAAQGLLLDVILIDDGVSGSIPLRNRPEGSKVFDYKQTSGAIIAVKLDRLFRDAEDALRTTREWDTSKIGLHIIDFGGQAINTSSAMGRVFLTMLAGFAELERNLIAERTTVALRYKKENGFVYSPVPFGYARNGDRLIQNPDEQDVLIGIRSMRDHMTLEQIATSLNFAGVPAKNGGRWYPSNVRSVLMTSEIAGSKNVDRSMPAIA